METGDRRRSLFKTVVRNDKEEVKGKEEEEEEKEEEECRENKRASDPDLLRRR